MRLSTSQSWVVVLIPGRVWEGDEGERGRGGGGREVGRKIEKEILAEENEGQCQDEDTNIRL